ncbi:subtilisin-like protein [Hymenopellis radicata]|nr:subtilisin-like protein [Hymenopellis radicata]
MKLISVSAALAAFALTVSGHGNPRAMTVHESREAVPQGFVPVETAKSETMLDLRIALTPRNITGLEHVLLSVSTPGSPLYGQYLSLDEVKDYASPTEDSVTAVKTWLAEHGVTDVAVTGAYSDWLSIRIPIGTANILFAAKFQHFLDVDSGEEIARTLEYSLPEDLRAQIALVHPTISFAKPQSGPTTPIFSMPVPNYNATLNPDVSCDSLMTPACIQTLYGIPTTAAVRSSNTLAVTGFGQQYANVDDLAVFLYWYRTDPNTPAASFAFQSVDGGINPQDLSRAGLEANLDIQYTIGIATGVPVVFVTVGNRTHDGVGGFIDAFDFLSAQRRPPQVVTTSYAFNEADLPVTLARHDLRMCDGYMSLGARGVSLLFASGDGGVCGTRARDCTTFVPTFPGSCPWQTAVGATTYTNPEIGADLSSGGFSNYFSAPSYQTSAVNGYLAELGSEYSGLYNASGRGFPDVSAQGQNVAIVYRGDFATVDGTSCSSPIFASVISLVNAALIASGKPVLGFLNPFLYANPQAFFDITLGNNPGCEGGTDGFPATDGWDPVTGLGSPNFDALMRAVGL